MPDRLPEQLMPELRSRWIKYIGARAVVQAGAQAMQQIEREYQDTLNLALRMVGADPAVNHKVNLETGEIAEVTAADVVQQSQPQGAVPWVAPTTDSQN